MAKYHKPDLIVTPIGDGYVRLDLATGRVQILDQAGSLLSSSRLQVAAGSGQGEFDDQEEEE